MHPEALKLIVANCHKRQKEGDKPTTHPYSTEQLEDTIVDLNEQLLSVLAAIEDFKKQITIVCALSGDVAHQCDFHEINASKWWKAVQKLQKMIVVDLSLLHEHDAEVRAKTVTDLVSSGANKYIEERIAEVRKPLVDALRKCANRIAGGYRAMSQKITDEQLVAEADALAKMKP